MTVPVSGVCLASVFQYSHAPITPKKLPILNEAEPLTLFLHTGNILPFMKKT